MVQRRIVHRLFYLRPTQTTVATFAYCLGYAAKRTGMLLHDFMVLSNHYHIVLSDPHARLPKFMQILNSFVARAINASYGQFGTFWEREPYTAPELPDDIDLVDKCVYTLLNPCAADLVEHARDWPGLSSWAMEYGKPVIATRPDHVFGEDMPLHVELVLTRPPVMLELSDEQLRAEIRRRVSEREEQLIEKRATEGRRVLGAERVRAQRPDESPARPTEAFGTRPRVSTRSPGTKRSTIERNQTWLAEYRDALKSYLSGIREALFPVGTYLMHVRFGVRCASP
jgi:REP element-mobilizing transposase RayT